MQEVYFSAENLEGPEGVEAGDEFEVLATVSMTPEGMFTLLKVDGIPVSGESAKDQDVETAEGLSEQMASRLYPMKG
jgi:hypothetical protein